ncbi:MAG: hypothetical protein ACK45S_05290, partial [Sphingobacteriales bacterium]
LDIPERTITIEKTLPPMNEFYLGGGLTGASTTSLNGLFQPTMTLPDLFFTENLGRLSCAKETE